VSNNFVFALLVNVAATLTMISWTLFFSVPLVIIGAGTVWEWFVDWWSSSRVAFSTVDFKHAVESRYATLSLVQLIEAPSLTRMRGHFRRRPAIDRQLILVDVAGTCTTIDISWFGRFSMDESLERVAFDFALKTGVSITSLSPPSSSASQKHGTFEQSSASVPKITLRDGLKKNLKNNN
jgi:hypothetical protein